MAAKGVMDGVWERCMSATNSARSAWVASRILEMDSMDGQRGRPSAAILLEGLNVVGSSPARRARPDGVSRYDGQARSIADHTLSCDNMRALHALEMWLSGETCPRSGIYSYWRSCSRVDRPIVHAIDRPRGPSTPVASLCRGATACNPAGADQGIRRGQTA